MYKIKVKGPNQWYWRSFKCQSQQYLPEQDKIQLRLTNGLYHEVPQASKCEVRYGQDMIETLKGLRENANNVQPAQAQDHV